ncbi:AbiH family protein [Streptococcus sp. E24BD]|uniref:AbiH family protein n=1 Tax=Streptococcus sp. E24BD TaxID=3278715 RepID=UPI00359D3FC7
MDEISPIEELFIIGNGFDLQCGLGTTYENFLKYTFSKLDSNISDSINYDTFNLDEFSDKVSESIKYTDLHVKNWGELSRLDYYNRYDYYPKLNIWYHIFLYEKMVKNINWSSVESILATYLQDYRMIDYISSLIVNNKSKPTYKSKRISIPIPSNSKAGILAKIAFIIVRKKLNDLVLPNHFAYEKLQEIYNKPDEVDLNHIKEWVTQVLLHELNELEYDFQRFVAFQKQNMDHEYGERVNALLRKMLDPHVDLFNIEPRPYYLMSFNYSSIWSEIFRPKFSPKLFFDVHGRLPKNEGLKHSTIIFGVDASLFDATSFEYRFTKTYRTFKNYSIGFEEAGNGREIYSPTVKMIKFYGHSLAEADYSYFQQLFDHYNLYQNNDLKLIFYYSVFDKNRREEIEQEQLYSVSRLIEKYGQTMDNKNHGKNLLTRLIQTNRLQLVEL